MGTTREKVEFAVSAKDESKAAFDAVTARAKAVEAAASLVWKEKAERQAAMERRMEEERKAALVAFAAKAKQLRAEEDAAAKLRASSPASTGDSLSLKSLKSTMDMLRGGGAVAGFTMMGRAANSVVESMAKLKLDMEDADKSASAMALSLLQSLPLIGDFAKAGEGIRELFTGEKAAIDEINESIKRGEKLMQARLDIQKISLDTAKELLATAIATDRQRQSEGMEGIERTIFDIQGAGDDSEGKVRERADKGREEMKKKQAEVDAILAKDAQGQLDKIAKARSDVESSLIGSEEKAELIKSLNERARLITDERRRALAESEDISRGKQRIAEAEAKAIEAIQASSLDRQSKAIEKQQKVDQKAADEARDREFDAIREMNKAFEESQKAEAAKIFMNEDAMLAAMREATAGADAVSRAKSSSRIVDQMAEIMGAPGASKRADFSPVRLAPGEESRFLTGVSARAREGLDPVQKANIETAKNTKGTAEAIKMLAAAIREGYDRPFLSF